MHSKTQARIRGWRGNLLKVEPKSGLEPTIVVFGSWQLHEVSGKIHQLIGVPIIATDWSEIP